MADSVENWACFRDQSMADIVLEFVEWSKFLYGIEDPSVREMAVEYPPWVVWRLHSGPTCRVVAYEVSGGELSVGVVLTDLGGVNIGNPPEVVTRVPPEELEYSDALVY